jgi:ribosome biogenesis protein BRX1
MSPVLKVHEQDTAIMEIRKGKRKVDDLNEDGEGDVVPPKRKRNKQRVLLLSSRGITHRMRHLMNDLETLLPHVKKGVCVLVEMPHSHWLTAVGISDSKLDSKNHLNLLPELADLHSCNNTLYFEARRHEDLYLWAAKTPNGPSIKLHVQNVHTMDELKMTGNCLKGSRGILSFDAAFEETEWGRLTKELFTHVSVCAALVVVVRGREFLMGTQQIFGVPPQARRAKPFIDHVLAFSLLDSKIWFRNFQVRHAFFFLAFFIITGN